MNVNTRFVHQPSMGGLRPNPAETIETGVELGADPVQQDLFALTAGISDIKVAPEFAEVGKTRGFDSWQKGAYSLAAALAGTPAAGIALIQAVEGMFEDPVSRGFFAIAGGLAGQEELERLKETTAGYGKTAADNGVIAVSAAIAGAEGADEAIQAGLSEGKDSREGALLALATALAGGAQQLEPTLAIARDFASSPELAGPYAVAVALAGSDTDTATPALRMAEDLGQNDTEKALFALVGGLVGAERGPGFVRMSRALSPQESQVGSMAVAATLTAADASRAKEAATAAMALLVETR